MKLRHFFPCLLMAGMAVTVASCTEEATLTPGQGRNVTMTVNISRVGDNTRSILEENAGNLKCTWEAADLILVVDGSGNKLGVLSLKTGAGEESATFVGEITTDAVGETGLNFLYLGSKSAEEMNNISTPVVLDYSAQEGTLDWISNNDFFCGSTNVNIVNSYVNVESVKLARQLAFGKFEMHLPEEVVYNSNDITVSGDGIYTQAIISSTGNCTFSNAINNDGEITVKPIVDEEVIYFYLTVLPTEKQIKPTFSVTIDGVEYSCSLAPRTWKASEFVRKENTDGSFSGISLSMVPPAVENEDDLVGPVFEVNGKSFRFTRANLHYNTADKTWYLPEKQTDFVGRSGRKYLSGQASNQPGIVDLFRWGATGIDDTAYQPRPADFWKDYSYSSNTRNLINNMYPSANSSLNLTLNTNTTLCPNGSMQDTPWDWGSAYGKTHSGNYFTLTSTELNAVINANCVVLGSVDDVNGAILTSVASIEELKSKLDDMSITYTTLYKLTSGCSNTNYQWTRVALTYDQLNQLNGVFFPAAGYCIPDGSSDYNNKGYYWTSTVDTQPNAITWMFNGEQTQGNRFFKVGGTGKAMASSVRLVKEVTTSQNSGNTVGGDR